MRTRHLLVFSIFVFVAGIILSVPSFAQDSGFNLSLHANAHTTSADVGLPGYPGASVYKDKDNDGGVDLGYSFGDTHFRLMVASYVTGDSPAKVLDFYRKALSRYGEVLECNGGKPVGSPSTRSGLTCSDDQGGHVQISEHNSNDHELRAGKPHDFRVVGIEKAEPKSTRFSLVYLQVPKDKDAVSK